MKKIKIEINDIIKLRLKKEINEVDFQRIYKGYNKDLENYNVRIWGEDEKLKYVKTKKERLRDIETF